MRALQHLNNLALDGQELMRKPNTTTQVGPFSGAASMSWLWLAAGWHGGADCMPLQCPDMQQSQLLLFRQVALSLKQQVLTQLCCRAEVYRGLSGQERGRSKAQSSCQASRRSGAGCKWGCAD